MGGPYSTPEPLSLSSVSKYSGFSSLLLLSCCSLSNACLSVLFLFLLSHKPTATLSLCIIDFFLTLSYLFSVVTFPLYVRPVLILHSLSLFLPILSLSSFSFLIFFLSFAGVVGKCCSSRQADSGTVLENHLSSSNTFLPPALPLSVSLTVTNQCLTSA